MLPSRRQRRLGSSLPPGGLLARAGVTHLTLFSGSRCLGVHQRTETALDASGLASGAYPKGTSSKLASDRRCVFGVIATGARDDHPPRPGGSFSFATRASRVIKIGASSTSAPVFLSTGPLTALGSQRRVGYGLTMAAGGFSQGRQAKTLRSPIALKGGSLERVSQRRLAS